MQSQSHNFRKTALRSALALALAITSWLPGAARAADQEGTPKSSPMRQITTQAQAEALKPGDSIAMVCAMCKIVNVEQVTADQTHVKTLTVGEKLACPTCGATVEVVATGTGEGRNAEVNYVCSECGDQAMFVTATEPGSGSHAKRGNDGAPASRHDAESPMKRNPRFLLATALSILAVSVGILGLSGCATTKQVSAGDEQVLVCPECKIVTETIERPGLGGYDDYYNVGLDPDPGVDPDTIQAHLPRLPGSDRDALQGRKMETQVLGLQGLAFHLPRLSPEGDVIDFREAIEVHATTNRPGIRALEPTKIPNHQNPKTT